MTESNNTTAQTRYCTGCGDKVPLTIVAGGLCLTCQQATADKLRVQRELEEKEAAGRIIQEAEDNFDKVEEANKELAKRELARRRFLPFVQRFNPDYIPGWVHVDICSRLEKFMEDVAEKKSPRLMLFMPPRHGKSQLSSKTYASWVLGHYPQWEFMNCSYSGSLAMQFSRNVRSIMRDPSYHSLFDTQLDPDSQSVEHWMTTEGGGLTAAGVGGAITGKGAHIMIIDDPVKNREDAESETSRQSCWDWYTSTAYTRLAPGGGVLVILTRWHDDDLAGRLLSAEKEGGDSWQVVEYPAIAEEDEPYRKKGEALHPDRYPIGALHRIRKAIGPRDWSALYQQSPVADEGAYFTRTMFNFYDDTELPPKEELMYYTAWDLAVGTKEANDWTVGVTVAMDMHENLWVVDRVRRKTDASDTVEAILDNFEQWPAMATGIEKGQIEMAIGPFLERRVAERKLFAFNYEELKPGRRDKQARGRAIQGLMRTGKVRFPDPEKYLWCREMMHEMLRFPSGIHDDQVDAISWIGLMINEMVTYQPPIPEKKPSWKDKLDKFVTNDDTKKRWLSA
jgi:predicted phage terminase large subunit-like protein